MLLDPNPTAFPSDSAVAWGEDAYGLWQAIELNGVRQVMRWIEPGQFLMGSPEDEKGRSANEQQHQVTLSKGYWLADTACTQALWQAVMQDNPAHFTDDPENPVEQVSWDDCKDFVQMANELLQKDLQLRLPTEAEWEYACRAGSRTAFQWGDELTTEQANYRDAWDFEDFSGPGYRKKTLPVLSFPPNRWGLFQMHGNVWEWCADWLGDYPAELVVDPTGPTEGQERVLRGGSWSLIGRGLRSADRYAYEPGMRDFNFGLRLAGG